MKQRLWLIMLALRHYVPRELLAGPGDCVLQVGTPNSVTIERLRAIVGPAGTIIVVEPEPHNVKKLSSHIRTHNLTNVILVPKAAWNRRERLSFLIGRRSLDHRINNLESVSHDNDLLENAYVGSMEIEADTIDNIIDELGFGAIGYVEIAVNGAEREVLEGMSRSLARARRLFVKGHARVTQTGEPINREIAALLQAQGFVTKLSRPSHSTVFGWGMREGDVLAWRP